MRCFFNFISSLKVTILLLIIIAVAVGLATVIENFAGSENAQQWIYHAIWFQILGGLLLFNLITCLIRYKLLENRKIAVFVFHVSFVLIFVGALVSHYFGESGMIHLRNGECASTFLAESSSVVQLPFIICLQKFEIQKYTGSDKPSSFDSYLDIKDIETNEVFNHHLFMNNILKYRGFRVFQSSYDPDEKGTILTVSHDLWGTRITYFGYILMTIGMILTFFSKNSRFFQIIKLQKQLLRKSLQFTLIVLSVFVSTFSVNAMQKTITKKEFIRFFESILVQNTVQGRIEPLGTYQNELMQKIVKSLKFNNLSPSDWMLNCLVDSGFVRNEKIIKINDSFLATKIRAKDGYVSVFQLIKDSLSSQILSNSELEKVYQTFPSQRSASQKEIIYLAERLDISLNILRSKQLLLFPQKDKWLSYGELISANSSDKMKLNFVKCYQNFICETKKALKSDRWAKAYEKLMELKNLQRMNNMVDFPSESRVRLELIYNHCQPFILLAWVYLLLGVLFFGFYLFFLFSKNYISSRILSLFSCISFFLLIVYTIWLVFRWYLAGHAPWSDGYETMLFLGWTIALLGVILGQKNIEFFFTSAFASSIVLIVANMSWMNPQISHLVPVLKSYWLIIHVAVIIASYGALTLGALLGVLNLFLIIARNKYSHLNVNVLSVSYLLELSLTLGVFMLSIGCILGAIWANESWGSYWSWDPKESWVLVSIVFYAIILHIRKISDYNVFALSALSVLGFSIILMTFLGVNYLFSGMHSYAKTDMNGISFALGTIMFLNIVLILFSYRSYRKFPGKRGVD